MTEKVDFPEWKGYSSITKDQIELTKKLWLNDKDVLAKGLLEAHMREEYFKGMLLYVQERLEKHLNGEPLGLCLNSSTEIFEGLMIAPCEKTDIKDEL